MEPLVVAGGLALTLAVILFVAQPLWRERQEVPQVWPSAEVRRLQERRERLLGALNELDVELGMGKVRAEDYPRLRAELEGAAVGALQDLETAEAGDAAIRRQLDSDIQEARGAGEAASADHCGRCGRVRRPEDRFCPQCGHGYGA